MKNLITLLLALFVSQLAMAQQFTQTIKGRVVDQQSKSPIIGATIIVKDSDPILGSSSDLDGYFKIGKVPIGRVTLVFSSVGYESKTIPNVTVTSGKEVVIDMELIESLTKMEEVIVTADRQDKGQPRNEMATVSAISLSVEETSRYAATFNDPARAALSQAGVTTGGDDLLNEIVIRGNSPKGMLWRLEGVEIPNPNHFASVGSSAGGISMLSSNVLANSDFFTGAFPAQYGNAYSGIFDLKMRNGNFDKREHSFQAGLLGIQASSEGPFKQGSNASYLFNYRYSTLGLFSAIGLDIIGEEEFITFQDLSFKLNLPTKKLGTFSVWGLGGLNTYESHWFNGYRMNGDSLYAHRFYDSQGLGLDDPGRSDSLKIYRVNDEDQQHMGAVGVTHVAYFNKNTYLESVASFTSGQVNYKYDSSSIRQVEQEKVGERSMRFSSMLNKKFNARNTLRVGMIVSRLSYELDAWEYWWKTDTRYTFLDESGSTWFYQGYAQWQHRVNQQLSLNMGLHASHFALNENSYIEPRLGARYQVTPRTALTFGAGLHSRMESLSFYMAQDSLGIQQNRDLGFARAAHLVLGAERMLRPDLRLKMEMYYQHLYEVPVWADDTTTNPELGSISALNEFDGYTSSALANEGTGRNYGVELTLEQFFTGNYYYMINGSLYESKYTGIDGVERNTIFNGNYIFNALGGREFRFAGGRKALNLNARYIFAGGKRQAPVSALRNEETGFYYPQYDYSRNYELKLNNYWRVDLGISYKVNKEKTASVLSINVQNLFSIGNEYLRYIDWNSGKVMSDEQLGFFPNLSYKIEF